MRGRSSLWSTVCLGLWLSQGSAWGQQVWKCDEAGQVRYADRPCSGASEPLSARSLQPNVADGLRPGAARAAVAPAIEPASAPVGRAANVCPGDSEIRAMETRGNSTTFGDEERQFMQDEVRRARQCRTGRGRYTEADWAISREAQAAQTRLSARERREARSRAEAMHAAADADEEDRIARQQMAEDRLRLPRQNLRRNQRAAEAPSK